jgi:D-alanine-D-alanine ligase
MSPDAPRVLLLHNVPRQGAEGPLESDAGVLEEVRAVDAALDALGVTCRIAGVASLAEVPRAMLAGDETIVFNLVEDLPTASEDACDVPSVVRAMGRSHTGSDSACLRLATDKWRSHAILAGDGVPVPQAVRVSPGERVPHDRLPEGTLILKPACCDASEGIDAGRSIFDSAAGTAIDEAVADLHRRFDQPVLIERYIEGRELNVSVLERDGHTEVLAIAEIDFSAFPPGRARIVDYAAKWLPDSFEYRNTPRRIPARMDETTARRVRDLALASWNSLGCRDYARIDFRLDAQGSPWVLEVNPNPDISPDAGFAAALDHAGISYPQFVRDRLRNAARGRQAALSASADSASPSGSTKKGSDPFSGLIRRTRAGDREAIVSLVERTGFFRAEEVLIATEVLDEALRDGLAGHYQSFTALLDDRPVGWVCYGATPCTVGTFDVYWIAVDPGFQGRRIGSALLTWAERGIAGRRGRLAVAETSGRADYEPTRKFYLHRGYHQAGRLRDFYAPGDDKVVYLRQIPHTQDAPRASDSCSRALSK